MSLNQFCESIIISLACLVNEPDSPSTPTYYLLLITCTVYVYVHTFLA